MNEGGGKKFGTTEIVLGIIISFLDDAANAAALFLGLVPFIGEVVIGGAEVLHIVVSAILIFWFTLKLGFGGGGLLQTAGSLAEMVGVPGRTVIFLIGVYIANHPKLTAVAELASGKIAGGEAQATAEMAQKAETAASAGAGTEQAGALAGRRGDSKETTKAGLKSIAQGEPGDIATGLEEEGGPTAPAGQGIEEEAFGVAKDPLDQLQEVMRDLPKPEKPGQEEQGGSAPRPRPPVEDIRRQESL